MVRSDRHEISNLVSRNYFAEINSSLIIRIPTQARCILQLKEHDEKYVEKPASVRFDFTRIIIFKNAFPVASRSDGSIKEFFYRSLTLLLIPVIVDRATKVLGSTFDFVTSSCDVDLFKMVETLLKRGEDAVENRCRCLIQVNVRIVAAKYLSQPGGSSDYF